MFRKLKQDRRYKVIANQVLEAIFRGDLAPNDKLPSEKELQEIFGVSRVTVREAIQSLEQFGVIEVRQGSQGGSYITQVDLDMVLSQIRNALKMTNLTLQQVTDARAVLEEAILRRLIPSRISGEDFARLERNIASAEACFKNKQDKERLLANFEFHTMIAEMTGNPIIILMHKLIHELLYEFFENVQPSVPMTQGTLEEHKRIAEYLREGDFEAASLVCLGHIEKVSRQIGEKSKQQSFLGKSKSPR